MGDLLGCLQSRVDDRDGDHPYTMLYAGWQHGDLWEEALVRRTGHYLIRVSFRAAIWAHDDDCRAEILDEVPSSAGNCEDVGVCADISEDFEGSVMLEK